MRSRIVSVAALAAVALGLSACSTKTDAVSSESGFSADATSAAEEMLAKYTDVPAPPELTPLSPKPSADKLVTMISCPLPACTNLSNEFTKAGEALGWKVRVIVSEFTPESFTSAFDSAIALKPDGLYYFAMFPNNVIKAQLDRAKQAGIPVVMNGATPDTELGGDSPVAAGTQPGQNAQSGQLEAAMVIADAKSKDGITFMYQPGNAALEAAYGAFKDAIEKAGGTVDPLKINQADIGTTLPSQVVSYLQSHPDTKYLVNPGSHLMPGVVEAIKGAGLTVPKILSYAAETDTAKAIKAGDNYGAYVIDVYAEQWMVVDFLARTSVGEHPDPELVDPVMVLTPDNVDDFPGTLPLPGFEDAYKKAWGVS